MMKMLITSNTDIKSDMRTVSAVLTYIIRPKNISATLTCVIRPENISAILTYVVRPKDI